MFTINQIKEHLIGLGHSGTLKKIRNIEAMLERSASKFLLRVHPVESMRTAPLSSVVHDDLTQYALPTDFGSLIDLIPEADRQSWDVAFRDRAGTFDQERARKNRTLSIEGSGGTKIARINWKSRAGKVLNRCDSLTANGTWAIVATASNLALDEVTKFSGSASIKFDVAATGDGVSNTTMTAVDLTDENGVSDLIFPLYLESDYAYLTSVTPTWGNDLTTKYWTGVAQTAQADGTAFQQGWNLIKASWKNATQTGTVAPATIDSFKVTLTVTAAMTNVRLDNVLFSIGRAFDAKYYSKFLFKSATSGAWMSKPVSGTDDDYVVIDNDTLPQFLFECLKDMAHQMEGTDSTFDINYAENELKTLYPAYKGLYPSAVKKVRGRIGSLPGRGRW